MKLYRIYTENKNREQVEQAVGVLFDGFTVFKATGCWQGNREHSLIIEIADDGNFGMSKKVYSIACTIRDLNHQQCVLVQELEIEVKFI